MVETRSSGSRADDTLVRVDGLEKAMAELTTHVRSLDTTLDERIRRCIEPVLRELRGTPIEEPISEAHPHKSGENALDEDASSPTPTTAVPPSMALPSFDGTYALGWLARAGQYFMVNKTPDAARMDLALIALSGPALPWIQIVKRRYPSLSWSRYARELIIRFGDYNTHDGYEALAATKHDGSLTDYISLSLKPSIRMYLQDPSIYSDAVQMAKRYENISLSLAPTTKHVSGSSSTSRYFSQQSTNHGKQAPQITAPSAASVGPRPPNRFGSMSTEEYRKHLAAGTCFKCGLKYSPTHCCPPKTLKVIVEDDDSTDEDEETGQDEHTNSDLATFHHLQLSELSSHGLDSYQTMKFSGTIGASSIKIMVDSGASHCFIADHMATSLGLEITPTTTFSVRLGDGSKVRSGGICQNVKLGLASEEFILSCYVFPLRGVDLILGISWLASFKVKANWRELTMEFKLSGRLVQLQGDPTLTRRACTSSELRSVSEIDDSWLLWSLEGTQALPAFGLNDTLPSSVRRQLRDLLEAFPAISTAATSLPPHRTTDHRITLQPGSEPVSVRPYHDSTLSAIRAALMQELILDRRSVMRDSVLVAQVLVKWVGLSTDEATWVDEEDMRCQFPFFSLVDKAVSTGKAIDSDRPWKVYTRGPRQVANYNQ
ncbi:hypothetical protein SASPL_141171 [Salvia splendens]|uniref:Chromo domain-containing protein n=1 Tax=Salvia splendens TaxID=180675 RepID=A0A8X8WQ33_SALSN|nr:hypothetical protein SASPL_141171 [Salvia splendens]